MAILLSENILRVTEYKVSGSIGDVLCNLQISGLKILQTVVRDFKCHNREFATLGSTVAIFDSIEEKIKLHEKITNDFLKLIVDYNIEQSEQYTCGFFL